MLITILSIGRGKAKGNVGMLSGNGIETKMPGLPIVTTETIIKAKKIRVLTMVMGLLK